MRVLPADSTAPRPTETAGAVTVDCALDAAKLVDCHVVREDPPGRGLGVEAVAITGKLTADSDLTAKARKGRVQFAIKLPVPDPTN